MIDRNRRGIRSTGKRARLAVAAAVLVGGGAAGVVVANSHSGTTTAQSAGYAQSYHSGISEQVALTEALSSWSSSQSKSLAILAELTQLRSFVQIDLHHTVLAAQRGIVVLATKKFLVVKSANGALHLWWTSGATGFKDVATSTTGWTALTGSKTAANAAMATGNLTPAANVMAGSISTVSQLTTPVVKPTTITITTGNEVITITVANSTATTTTAVTTTKTTTTQPVFTKTSNVQRGDLVFVAGVRTNGELKAQLVLFAAPLNKMPSSSSSSGSSSSSSSSSSTGAPFSSGSHS